MKLQKSSSLFEFASASVDPTTGWYILTATLLMAATVQFGAVPTSLTAGPMNPAKVKLLGESAPDAPPDAPPVLSEDDCSDWTYLYVVSARNLDSEDPQKLFAAIDKADLFLALAFDAMVESVRASNSPSQRIEARMAFWKLEKAYYKHSEKVMKAVQRCNNLLSNKRAKLDDDEQIDAVIRTAIVESLEDISAVDKIRKNKIVRIKGSFLLEDWGWPIEHRTEPRSGVL